MRIAASLFVFSVIASSAWAQTCGAQAGPDLAVGNTSGPSNYTALGGIDACSFGVLLTNFGTQTIVVSSGTANHPIVLQNLYRYEVVNGTSRFEQIGMSWAWESYFMLEQNNLCTCSPTGNGNLGPGCSSPSTSFALGTQSNQGPRSEINAFTGVFQFPPSNPPFSGTVARRLQFALSDVDPALHSGAQYFVEQIAISPDDAAAGNGLNNASYAPVSIQFNGTEATLSLGGFAAIGQPAILAWQVLDPSVVVHVVQAPSEGTFYVASRATDLGGGAWHYEYAIENLNSDYACGALQVNYPLYAAPFNLGFHDVAYHDGDGPGGVTLDGTDWTTSLASGQLHWSTQSFASNPSANALRAATLYDFRFDANAGPVLGSAQISTWKIAAAVDVPAMVPDIPPPAGTAYCFGDGSGTACPCGNVGLTGHGCGNSAHAEGGALVASGVPSLAQDTLTLVGGSMNDSSCLFFQGTTALNGGAGVVFGDGLRCGGGSIVRLGIKTNVSGSSAYGFGAHDILISQRGLVSQPGLRTYQAWYRNASPTFCTSDTFNLTNGISIAWLP